MIAVALAGLLVMGAASSFAAPPATNDSYLPQLWGLSQIGAFKAWEISKGRGVVIAIVDSGVDLEHPDFGPKLRVFDGADIVEPESADGPDDPRGHGTHVAGIAAAVANNSEGVAGAAPKAKILPVRVVDAEGSADTDDVATGSDSRPTMEPM